MAPRRRPTALDDEMAALEREVAAATGSPVPAADHAEPPSKRARGDRLEQARTTSRSLFRKLAAVAILIVAAAVLLRVAIGVISGILWIVIAVVAVVSLVWAWRQLR
jgi:uncharacterized membrane protein